jgi:predicted peptidase
LLWVQPKNADVDITTGDWNLHRPKSMFLQIIAVLIATQIVPEKRFEDRFQALEIRSAAEADGRVYRYRLYVPPEHINDHNLPLLIWLHGHGERGEENLKSLKWLPLLFEMTDDKPPFFILVPQHHSDETWVTPAEASTVDALSVTYQMLEQIMVEYSVDSNRVYLAGVSSGGSACWELATRHPELFAAVAPMSSSGGNISKAGNLIGRPVWAFHSSVDRMTPPEGVRAMVNAVNKAGGIAALTEVEPSSDLSDHDSWTLAFCQYHVVDWLLAQHRGVPVASLPGELTRKTFVSLGFALFKRSGWIILCWLVFAFLARFVWLRQKSRTINRDDR